MAGTQWNTRYVCTGPRSVGYDSVHVVYPLTPPVPRGDWPSHSVRHTVIALRACILPYNPYAKPSWFRYIKAANKSS
jgi:hypothetical protein